MNAVMGSVTVNAVSVLRGDHHIISALSLKDGLEGLLPGMPLIFDTVSGKYIPAVGGAPTTEDPVAILLEVPDMPTSGAVQPVVLHGAINRGKVLFSDGVTAVSDDYVELLRKNGIYAIAG